MKKISILFLFIFNYSFSQSAQDFKDLGNLLNDATFFSDKYISPATDAAVYQSSSNWVNSVKKRKLWNVAIGLHSNLFLVPNSDRSFQINNSDFSFFHIEGASSATVPTAIGNGNQVYLVGQLSNQQVRLQTPKGIDQRMVFYPHLSGSLSIWWGTELLVKYGPKTTLEKSEFEVYGLGLKHSISQYFKKLIQKKINIAASLSKSKEIVSFDFLDVNTAYGNLGINRITSTVNTWQVQLNVSKEYKKFEFIAGIIGNRSDFKYELTGEKGQIEQLIPFQYILNEKLKEIYKTKNNFMGELSCRYQIGKIYLQSTIAFGKFVNSNLSVQYEF